MKIRDEDEADNGDNPHPWRFRIGGFALLVAGFWIFEWSGDPALLVVSVCLKFGVEDFRTAVWLNRHDPYPARGTACFWMHVSLGLGKIVLAALGSSVLIIAVLNLVVPRLAGNVNGIGIGNGNVNGFQAPFVHQLFGAMALAFVGSFSSSLSCLMGIWKALKNHLKLWVSPLSHHARRKGYWPPGGMGWYGGVNSLQILVMMTLSVSIPAFGMVFLFPILFVTLLAPNPAFPPVMVAMLVFCLIFAVAISSGFVFLKGQIIAAHPSQCWPETFHDFGPGSGSESGLPKESAE